MKFRLNCRSRTFSKKTKLINSKSLLVALLLRAILDSIGGNKYTYQLTHCSQWSLRAFVSNSDGIKNKTNIILLKVLQSLTHSSTDSPRLANHLSHNDIVLILVSASLHVLSFCPSIHSLSRIKVIFGRTALRQQIRVPVTSQNAFHRVGGTVP